MSLEAVVRLKQKWASDRDLRARLERSFDAIGFTHDYVEKSIDAAKRGHVPRRSKDIKDNIWGMIEIDWPTLRLIDSPVMQRLRGIKQLGLSYLTYPTADHSRFAHSLGVSHVASRFLAACERRARQETEENPGELSDFVGMDRLPPLTRQEIIHAAILHDVGHMPFSHATEGVIDSLRDSFRCGGSTVDDFLSDVEALGKSSLSEALSLAVVLSDRFSRFYTEFVCERQDGEESLLRIAGLIVSIAPNERLVGVPDIISSHAVDADRVDYINRDAAACGIRVAVDVARLFLRSGFLEASREKLKHLKDDAASQEVHFFVSAAGMDALEEITQARAALYQRVYYHPVTRTAEGLLAQTLHYQLESEPDSDLADALGLWALSDNVLLAKLNESPFPVVKASAARIYTRSLPKKGCAFSALIAEMHMPIAEFLPRLSPTESTNLRKQITSAALKALSQKRLTSPASRNIESAIRREADNITQYLEEHDKDLPPEKKLIPASKLETVLLVGSRYMSAVVPECYVLQNGQLLSSSDFTTTVEQQDAADIFKAVGFVMCDAEWRAIVLIAARRVIFGLSQEIMPSNLPLQRTKNGLPADSDEPQEYDEIHIMERSILGLDGAMRRSNIQKAAVDKLVLPLEYAGYFDGAPLLGSQISSNSADVVAIAGRLEGFDGQRSWRVKPASVAAFLNQFPKRLRPSMTEALRNLRFFDSAEVSSSIFQALRELSEVDIIPLSPNSGSRTRQILENEAEGRSKYAGWRFCRTLQEALEGPLDRPLAFVDDNIASSVQARSQFLQWLGVDRGQWPDDCQSEEGIFKDALTGQARERLQQRPIHLGLCAGLPTADGKLGSLLAKWGVNGFVSVKYSHDLQTGFDWPDDLRSFLTTVGRNLIAWAKYGGRLHEMTAEQVAICETMALGYGNVGGLTATVSNVPSSTVTAIWCPGLYNDSPWMPLLIRQNKIKALILA